ncbi:NADH-quinone oxidoreductase subunit NuoE [Terrihabitans rhizophilus]|uniref:NADH-quinone oxidoreductase subunit NuoE n=1 Tax=Terrihabitans rhizophilus TaxID=3092662 RepID=UPI003CC6A766
MSVRRLAAEQPASFAFTPDNVEWARGQIAKYPEGRQASAVVPLLWKAQEQHGGWLPEPAIRAVAEMLGMAYIRVLEVATFYTMFALEPVGKHFVQVCGTTPCLLRGADKLMHVCERVIGHQNHVSEDGQLSWLEVECLGSCSNAPMAQINYDYFEDLDPESFEKLLDDLRNGRPVKPGPQIDRPLSGPAGGPTTLLDETLYDGSVVGSWRNRFDTAPAPEQAPTDAAKPHEQSPGEKQASDSPGDRAARGESPIKASDQAAAASEAPAEPSLRKDTADTATNPAGEGLKTADAPSSTIAGKKDAE